MRFSRPFRIGLVLGGGGARGSAHAGVIAALEREGVHADFVVGTSMGAFIGAAYALDEDVGRLKERIEEAMGLEAVRRLEREFQAWVERRQAGPEGIRAWLQGMVGKVRKLVIWNRQAVQSSLVSTELLHDLAMWLVDDAGFEDLKVPFYAVAFDLMSNETVVFGAGLLRTALTASAAIPGVFDPVRIRDRVFVDGCVLDELPAGIARGLGADFVIAVDVSAESGVGAPRSGAECMGRVLQARAEWIRKINRDVADIVIRPDVADVHWSEFQRSRECMAAGEAAVADVLDELRDRLRRARRRTWLRRMLGRPPGIDVSVETADPLVSGERKRNEEQKRGPANPASGAEKPGVGVATAPGGPAGSGDRCGRRRSESGE